MGSWTRMGFAMNPISRGRLVASSNGVVFRPSRWSGLAVQEIVISQTGALLSNRWSLTALVIG